MGITSAFWHFTQARGKGPCSPTNRKRRCFSSLALSLYLGHLNTEQSQSRLRVRLFTYPLCPKLCQNRIEPLRALDYTSARGYLPMSKLSSLSLSPSTFQHVLSMKERSFTETELV